MPHTAQQLRSTIDAHGTLTLSLEHEALGDPGPDEVVVRIDAAPINPSDLGLLFGPADMGTARQVGTAEEPRVQADVPAQAMGTLAARLEQSLPVGNEGAGVVVAAGDSPAAKALLGRTVSIIGGATFATHRKIHVGGCQALPEGTEAEAGASWFVNPMTALCMVETMRMEGHTALLHTAAASNLGQMLLRLCQQDSVPLVNVVRRPAQVELLRGLGAEHVVDSNASDFREQVIAAIRATGATLAFDAIGGGSVGGQLLSAMEAAQGTGGAYSRYGSNVHKQLYIYGSLDRGPTIIQRDFGFAWSAAGWLLTPRLQQIGGERIGQLRQRVVENLTTTFASHYTRRVDLPQALQLEAIAAYGKQATGEKFLITPNAAARS